ncbi:MAG TPA: bifunctional phosphoribosyl-AMP cyclohydrolase/phosphoribosyl-ATP diphosphatase HisIE [Pyrinomonadaceae bacterium]|nr:bifunctional phosphoribosyl-AMP cyclohydrolase/phosphoribosyl-ATP diphosphatase HisIE [Pyrinomonadaceae bacterium]
MKADGETETGETRERVDVDGLKFDERGLVPVVVQDARTREVLTLAYMNAESLRRTLSEGETWFWSRARSALWHKGETSGHTQRVVALRLDCDSDALVALVEPAGPACHTGARTCFHRAVEGAPFDGVEADEQTRRSNSGDDDGDLGNVLGELRRVVESRRREMPAGAYTTYLFEKGLDKILKKVGEESAETIIAAKNEDAASLTSEVSDLLYHLVVLLVERGVTLSDVASELSRRSRSRKTE